MITSNTWFASTLSALIVAGVGLTPVAYADADDSVVSIQASGQSRTTVVTDRPGALYDCEDTAVFTVRVTDPDDRLLTEGMCRVRLTHDGGDIILEQEYDLAEGNPFEVEASLDVPGFVRCDVRGVDGYSHSQITARAAAGFCVEKIRQGYPEPDDFDAYWQELLERQAEIESPVTVASLPDSVGQQDGYYYEKVSIQTLDDGEIHGFLKVPADSQGPFAAMVMVQASGPGYHHPEPTFVRPDMMTLVLNVHAIDPGVPHETYQERYAALIADQPYWAIGADDRDTYYFRNAILGGHTAVQWLSNHPKFNGEDLLYLGSSQGGAFGLILAGLNPDFSAIAVAVPGLADHGGGVVGRSAGWPKIVENLADDDAERREELLEMTAYFDVVNFAKRVQSPAIFTVGFNDGTCPPSSVYAAYNAVPAAKFIMTAPLAYHPVPWEHLNGIWQWIQNELDDTHRHYRDHYQW